MQFDADAVRADDLIRGFLEDVQISAEVAQRIGASLQRAHVQMHTQAAQERARLERELAAIYSRMDGAYSDKLDGKIAEEFWQRKQADWQREELRIKSLISGLEEDKSAERLLKMQRILELAQNAYGGGIRIDSYLVNIHGGRIYCLVYTPISTPFL
jgi:hypothetical protein